MVEDVLFRKTILTNCKGNELFAILHIFFLENNLEWKYVENRKWTLDLEIRVNTALVYALMEPKPCLVVLAGCER